MDNPYHTFMTYKTTEMTSSYLIRFFESHLLVAIRTFANSSEVLVSMNVYKHEDFLFSNFLFKIKVKFSGHLLSVEGE